MNKELYLFSWINFGKYRNEPARLKSIIDTEDGRKWLHWMIDNTVTFKFDHTVLEYLKLQEENARYVLPTV